jgi:hypothetical protein
MVLSGTKIKKLPSLPLAIKSADATLRATPRKGEEPAQSATVSGLPVCSPRSSLFEPTLRREVIAICPLAENDRSRPPTYQHGQRCRKTQHSRSFAANAKYGRRQPDVQVNIPYFEVCPVAKSGSIVRIARIVKSHRRRQNSPHRRANRAPKPQRLLRRAIWSSFSTCHRAIPHAILSKR